MHFYLSELCAVSQNIQQFGFTKIIFFILLSYHIVEAANYCPLCQHHVACNNDGVRFLETKLIFLFDFVIS